MIASTSGAAATTGAAITSGADAAAGALASETKTFSRAVPAVAADATAATALTGEEAFSADATTASSRVYYRRFASLGEMFSSSLKRFAKFLRELANVILSGVWVLGISGRGGGDGSGTFAIS